MNTSRKGDLPQRLQLDQERSLWKALSKRWAGILVSLCLSFNQKLLSRFSKSIERPNAKKISLESSFKE